MDATQQESPTYTRKRRFSPPTQLFSLPVNIKDAEAIIAHGTGAGGRRAHAFLQRCYSYCVRKRRDWLDKDEAHEQYNWGSPRPNTLRTTERHLDILMETGLVQKYRDTSGIRYLLTRLDRQLHPNGEPGTLARWKAEERARKTATQRARRIKKAAAEGRTIRPYRQKLQKPSQKDSEIGVSSDASATPNNLTPKSIFVSKAVTNGARPLSSEPDQKNVKEIPQTARAERSDAVVRPQGGLGARERKPQLSEAGKRLAAEVMARLRAKQAKVQQEEANKGFEHNRAIEQTLRSEACEGIEDSQVLAMARVSLGRASYMLRTKDAVDAECTWKALLRDLRAKYPLMPALNPRSLVTGNVELWALTEALKQERRQISPAAGYRQGRASYLVGIARRIQANAAKKGQTGASAV